MTMTNTVCAREMSLDELENVAGGTVKQLNDLIWATCNNPKFPFVGAVAWGHVPFMSSASATLFEVFLSECYDIEAGINVGFFGTGMGSGPNTYRDKKTGKVLTHAEVVAKIKGMG